MLAKITDILNGFREKLTSYIGTISSDHAYIHKGIAFSVVGLTGSITAGGTYKIAFKTPKADALDNEGQNYIHWRPSDVGGTATGVTAELYEWSSATGTDVIPFCRNRNISKKSKMQQFLIAATVTEGTRIAIINSGTAGAGAANKGGGGGAEHELLLKPDTVYSITLTNRSGSTATLISYELYWYEEDGYKPS